VRKLLFGIVLVGCYVALLLPLTDYLRHKPFAEKLGYVPQAEVLKFAAADQRLLLADTLVIKTLIYFGTLVEKSSAKMDLPPDYFSVFRMIETAIRINPYNSDAYYFAQAILVWDAKRIREANALLEYGLKYRSDDYLLPYFLGFNYSYFLKDYRKAAQYFQLAGELSGEPLFASLAGRYLYEAGQTDLALAYLVGMEKSAQNPAIKKSFQVRIAAFRQVKAVEEAVKTFQGQVGSPPRSIDELLARGFLREKPVDPYGGEFYLDPQGQVRTTSKFAFAGAGQNGSH